MTYKPSGYTSVAPYLTVNDAQGTIDFLVRVFGVNGWQNLSLNGAHQEPGEPR